MLASLVVLYGTSESSQSSVRVIQKVSSWLAKCVALSICSESSHHSSTFVGVYISYFCMHSGVIGRMLRHTSPEVLTVAGATVVCFLCRILHIAESFSDSFGKFSIIRWVFTFFRCQRRELG